MTDKKELAYQDYLNGMKYKEIAEKYGVTINTVKSWKTRYKWSRDGVRTKNESAHTPRSRGAPKGNKNALGNKGGAAPKGNQNATKHGLFSKYIPQETLELMGMLEEKSPADLIWDQIMIQYAAIIRAQSIMYVENKDEMIKELKKHKMYEDGEEIEYEFQFAWERQAQFLNAQSRAMSELRSLIKQFNELANEDDERRLKLQKMQLDINKTKAEIDKMKQDEKKTATTITVVDRWSDEDESTND